MTSQTLIRLALRLYKLDWQECGNAPGMPWKRWHAEIYGINFYIQFVNPIEGENWYVHQKQVGTMCTTGCALTFDEAVHCCEYDL